jgi:hypothetical protein
MQSIDRRLRLMPTSPLRAKLRGYGRLDHSADRGPAVWPKQTDLQDCSRTLFAAAQDLSLATWLLLFDLVFSCHPMFSAAERRMNAT